MEQPGISTEELHFDLYPKAFGLWARRVILAPLSMLVLIYTAYGSPAGKWFGNVPHGFTTGLWVLWVILQILALAWIYASLPPFEPTGKELDRPYLGALHRAQAVSDILLAVGRFFWIAFFILLACALFLKKRRPGRKASRIFSIEQSVTDLEDRPWFF